MTQWYGPQGDFYHASGQGGAWVAGPNGSMVWQPYAGSSADPSKTIWYGPNANYPGAAPVTYPPAPATPPDWRTQQSWWGSLYPTDTLQRTAYDLDPNFAWSTMVNHSGVNSWSPEYDWLRGQQGRDYAMYADQNTRAHGTPQGNMTFADWIEQNAPTLHQQYQMLPSSQKGYADIFQPGGRVTW